MFFVFVANEFSDTPLKRKFGGFKIAIADIANGRCSPPAF
jgi:hypothetical protein